jgi:hypothetical protein
MMNDDIKQFPVYGLCRQGLVPIEIYSTEDYNHYTHHLHHYIKQQDWKRNQKWFEERGIKQKLILLPVQVHIDLHACISDFKKKYNIDRSELLFSRRSYEVEQNNGTLLLSEDEVRGLPERSSLSISDKKPIQTKEG